MRHKWHFFDVCVWTLASLPGCLVLVRGLFGTQPEPGAANVLSAAAATSAVTAFALTLLLSLRNRFYDRLAEGLNVVYRLHHRLAIFVVILSCLHLASVWWEWYGIDPAVARTLVPLRADPLILTGWGALLVMLGATVASFRRRMVRRIWKRWHRLYVVAFGLIALHFFIYVDGRPLVARQFWVAFTLGGSLLASIVWLVESRRGKSRHPFEVVRAERLGEGIVEITLRPLAGKVTFEAGQFAYFSFVCKHGCGVSREAHPFSITSAPTEDELRISIKALGEDSKKLQAVQPGTIAYVEGPFGRLMSEANAHPNQLWIAGGMGVAPFIGTVRQLERDVAKRRDIVLITALEHPRDNLYASELATGASKIPGFRTIYHYRSQSGNLTAARIEALVPNWQERDIVLSGPKPMVESLAKELEDHGANPRHVHMEAFDF